MSLCKICEHKGRMRDVRSVLKAHGIKARWTTRLKYKGLSSESKNAFRKINLCWQDSRHEYASRLVERGLHTA